MVTKNQAKLLKQEGVSQCGKGFSSQLAVKTKLSKQTVYNFFNGEGVRPKTAEKLLDAGLELIEKAKREELKRERRVNRLLESSNAQMVCQTDKFR